MLLWLINIGFAGSSGATTKRIGGDDAPPKRHGKYKETERQRIRRLAEEQDYVDKLAAEEKQANLVKQAALERDNEIRALELELLEAERDDDAAQVLMLDDKIRREIVRKWLML